MTPIQTGINTLQVGALRLPCLIASCNSVMLTAELVTRAVATTLDFLGFKGESDLAKYISKNAPDLRPYKNLTNKTIAKRALGHAIFGIVSNAAVAYAFGPAPSIYNKVLTFLGPIRISTDVHPAFTFAASRFGR